MNEESTVILVFVNERDIDDFVILEGERNTQQIIKDTVDALHDEYAGNYDRIEVLTKTENGMDYQTFYE